jgi:hypothetical protein
MYVVWAQAHPIVQCFAIGTFPWQQLDEFENLSSTKVVKDFIFFLFLT